MSLKKKIHCIFKNENRVGCFHEKITNSFFLQAFLICNTHTHTNTNIQHTQIAVEYFSKHFYASVAAKIFRTTREEELEGGGAIRGGMLPQCCCCSNREEGSCFCVCPAHAH